MAVDFGFKMIGIAVGETEFKIGSSRPPLAASGALKKDAYAIVSLAKKEQVEVILLGLPVEETGQEGKMARICRTLGSHISQLGFAVAFVDESYTSVEAGSFLADQGLSSERQKQLVHGEAALLILERFTD